MLVRKHRFGGEYPNYSFSWRAGIFHDRHENGISWLSSIYRSVAVLTDLTAVHDNRIQYRSPPWHSRSISSTIILWRSEGPGFAPDRIYIFHDAARAIIIAIVMKNVMKIENGAFRHDNFFILSIASPDLTLCQFSWREKVNWLWNIEWIHLHQGPRPARELRLPTRSAK